MEMGGVAIGSRGRGRLSACRVWSSSSIYPNVRDARYLDVFVLSARAADGSVVEDTPAGAVAGCSAGWRSTRPGGPLAKHDPHPVFLFGPWSTACALDKVVGKG